MDIVYVRDLRVDAVIGIYDWEKSINQQVRIDLEMGWDNRKPAASDDIKDTLNYKEASQRVKQLVAETQFELVETLAEKIAAMLIKDMEIPQVTVTLGKPGAVKDSSEVGVKITRSKGDFYG